MQSNLRRSRPVRPRRGSKWRNGRTSGRSAEKTHLVIVFARANAAAYRDQYGKRLPETLKARAPTKNEVLAEMPPLPHSPSLARAAVALSVLRYNTVSDRSDALKGKGFEALAQLQGMLLSRIAGE